MLRKVFFFEVESIRIGALSMMLKEQLERTDWRQDAQFSILRSTLTRKTCRIVPRNHPHFMQRKVFFFEVESIRIGALSMMLEEQLERTNFKVEGRSKCLQLE
ncbi:hypothetical protein IV203_000070 [Nitzschia inconspicua]|uniref:Uncharacterized protein n=1 Tax=Nitzschia inconspicua TaxID=303405 RepID=A0A9K3L483_9STRA|nr:hypothetical protein IV203_000070 [Nitzschia inconspicua]